MVAEGDYRVKISVFAFKCLRCGHDWLPRVELDKLKDGTAEKSRICPDCKSAYWDRLRKNKKAKK